MVRKFTIWFERELWVEVSLDSEKFLSNDFIVVSETTNRFK